MFDLIFVQNDFFYQTGESTFLLGMKLVIPRNKSKLYLHWMELDGESCFVLELHSTTQTLTTCTRTHPMNTRTQTLPRWAPPKDWAPATCTHTHPMNTCTQSLPLWAPPKDWAPADLEILEVTNVVGTSHTGKFWKIQEKVRAPGFELWWAVSHWTFLPLLVHVHSLFIAWNDWFISHAHQYGSETLNGKAAWIMVPLLLLLFVRT
jgi:hypothetical protein